MMNESGGDATGNYVVITFDFYWLIYMFNCFLSSEESKRGGRKSPVAAR
jgi:hypothetical protein